MTTTKAEEQAPNFYTFCTSPKYLNSPLYSEHLVLGTLLFSEWCPNCSAPNWFDTNDPTTPDLVNVQLLDNGICPVCDAQLSDLVTAKAIPWYGEAAFIQGKQSGSSTWQAFAALYLTYKFLLNTHKYYEDDEAFHKSTRSLLHGTFVTNTPDCVAWSTYHHHVLNSPIFRELKTTIGDSWTVNESHIHFTDQYLIAELYNGNPENVQGNFNLEPLRGRTRLFAVVENLSWYDPFKQSLIRLEEQIYQTLQLSLLTVRISASNLLDSGISNCLSSYLLNVSSAHNPKDILHSIIAQEDPNILGAIKATWELNPTFSYADFEAKYDILPNNAMRDFACTFDIES